MKFYAIKKGRENNVIVHTWAECEALVKGYASSEYKSFSTEQEAKYFLQITTFANVETELFNILKLANMTLKNHYGELALIDLDTGEMSIINGF